MRMMPSKLLTAGLLVACGSAVAAVRIEGQVQGGGGPIANSTVTLWSASANAPSQLGQVKTDSNGHFEISVEQSPSKDASLYLVATGGKPAAGKAGEDNPAIGLMTVLGSTAPATVTINEFTTVASVATLADVLAGCVTRVTADACDKLFVAATPPAGAVPTDTLNAAQSIARYPWYQPGRLFALLDEFYSLPPVKMDGQPKPPSMRPVPFMPYLNWVPSAWVLPLKFDGGGYRAGGKAMFDSEGNLWVGNNFTIGWQGQDALWQGNASKFAPNGKPLSPITTGFAGGGMQGGTFGTAVDAHDNAWLTSYGGHSIAVFDKNGKPLTPPDGITFDGRLGLMQTIHRDAQRRCMGSRGLEDTSWSHFPKGDMTRGQIVCEGSAQEPCKSFVGPFHLAIISRTASGCPTALPNT